MSKRLKRSRLQLENLPDELLLKIFSYMNMQELLQYGQVSKRIREICSDKSFWEETYLVKKKVKPEFIKFILDRNCELLVIDDTVIDGCVKLNKASKLAYLTIRWNVYASKDFYHEILNSCCSLVSLELDSRKQSLNVVLQDLCKRNGQTLFSLKLAECHWISKNSLQTISKHCTELTKIDLTSTNISQDAMDIFVSALSPNVETICLAGNGDTSMTDAQIEVLVCRCNKITELDLDDAMLLTDASITSIIKHLKQSLRYLDLSHCPKISFEKVLELKSMPKLRILKYGFKSWHTMVLRKKLSHLKVNPDGYLSWSYI